MRPKETIGADSRGGPTGGRRWIAAFRALWDLAQDNDDTTAVFRVIEALRGNQTQLLVARMRSHPTGSRVLEERQSLLSLLTDRDRLRSLPEGTLGAAYLEFMEREGLTAEGLAAASESGYARPEATEEEQFAADLVRDSHDLWHVLTAYGRDPLGELCLLGVLYNQAKITGAGFIAALGVLRIFYEYPGAPVVRAVRQGFRTGREAECLVAQDWACLLELPLNEVREALHIPVPDRYLESLPRHDPSRSNSRAMQGASS